MTDYYCPAIRIGVDVYYISPFSLIYNENSNISAEMVNIPKRHQLQRLSDNTIVSDTKIIRSQCGNVTIDVSGLYVASTFADALHSSWRANCQHPSKPDKCRPLWFFLSDVG